MGLTPRPPKWGAGRRMLVSLSATVRLVLGLLEKPLGEQPAGVKTCWEDADAGRKPTQDRERVGGGSVAPFILHSSRWGRRKAVFRVPAQPHRQSTEGRLGAQGQSSLISMPAMLLPSLPDAGNQEGFPEVSDGDLLELRTRDEQDDFRILHCSEGRPA